MGEGGLFRNLTCPLMGIGGRVKNSQNRPYVVNEWPLTIHLVNQFLTTPQIGK